VTIEGLRMERGGCAAIAISSLTELHLQFCPHIDEEGARVFATGLARKKRSRYLKSIIQEISLILRGVLSSPHSRRARSKV
jgi:hypothetical protein